MELILLIFLGPFLHNIGGSSSQFVGCLIALFLIVLIKSIKIKINNLSIFLFLLFFFISLINFDYYNSERMLLSTLIFLSILILCNSIAIYFIKFDVSKNVLLLIFIFSSFQLFAIIGFNLPGTRGVKPVGIYIEPSHLALNYLPFLLFIILKYNNIFSFLLIIFNIFFAIYFKSLVLLIGLVIIIFLYRKYLLILLIPFFIILIFYDPYISERILGNSISTQAIISGYCKSFFALNNTFFGYGFNLMGFIPEFTNCPNSDINPTDGTTFFNKLIFENGYVGILFILFYLYFFCKILKFFKSLEGNSLLFSCIYITFIVNIFIRGTPYFGSSDILFYISSFYLIEKFYENKHS